MGLLRINLCRNLQDLTTADFLDGNVEVVVVVAVVSVPSLLSLLVLPRKPTIRAPSSSVWTRLKRLPAGQFSIEFFRFARAIFGVIPVVHTLASLLPVLLSLPVLMCLQRRSFQPQMVSKFDIQFSYNIQYSNVFPKFNA